VKANRPLLPLSAALGFTSVALSAIIDHAAGGGNHALDTAAHYNQAYTIPS
jgi:hypothetical protein